MKADPPPDDRGFPLQGWGQFSKTIWMLDIA